MSTTILKGNIISAPAFGQLDIVPNGYLIAENGIIQDVCPSLPEAWSGAPVTDYGDRLILQAFTDMHLHAPQYAMLGVGTDLPLLEWLQQYVFPAEARCAGPDYARTLYRQLARALIDCGTTRVCMFASMHTDTALILMEELERAGLTGYVGKVNMDRNGGADLQESTGDSERDTLRWLDACQDFRKIRPILTPRFTPSCSERLLSFLGRLAAERNLPIQSHLSESKAEIEWVQQLHPGCTQYWQTYDRFGLWTDRTLMAHCVWSDETERAAIQKAGVTVVHCADSNHNLCSGTAPVRKMLEEGIRVVLGSDIAGGTRLSMFDHAAATIEASKLRYMRDGTAFLTPAEAWYLAVSAPADFFGERPGFVPGQALRAMVLDDSALPKLDSLSMRLERCLYHRQPDAIYAVWNADCELKKRV